MTDLLIPSSFRDPSGVVFERDGILYRAVHQCYRENYNRLKESGLYDELVQEGLLISHEEVAEVSTGDLIIQPERVPFISYPYEWSFSQLKDAALLTLRIQKIALKHGMSLRDCSAYNVQFYRGKPVFIDTLSFEPYPAGQPWVAYRQFCQHFLAPIALMSRRDIRLGKLMEIYIDGIPLDLAAELLPWKTRLSAGLLMHIHMHAKYQVSYAGRQVEGIGKRRAGMSHQALTGIIDNLEATINGLKWIPGGTEWADYYNDTNYTETAFAEKRRLVDSFLVQAKANMVWDLGANDGTFSRLACEQGMYTMAFDIDPASVEKNYLSCKSRGEERMLPLLLDLTTPSPGIGWTNTERPSLLERGPADTVMALALVHHLAIGNNVPFSKIVELFTRCCRRLIIEFVPKSDSQVSRLLVSREDIFTDYTQDNFERAFARRFSIESCEQVQGSERTLYLMRLKE